MGTGTKIVTHTGMGMGTGIFLKCGYGDYSTLPIVIPTLAHFEYNAKVYENIIHKNSYNLFIKKESKSSFCTSKKYRYFF
jgi:hypothetical protein